MNPKAKRHSWTKKIKEYVAIKKVVSLSMIKEELGICASSLSVFTRNHPEYSDKILLDTEYRLKMLKNLIIMKPSISRKKLLKLTGFSTENHMIKRIREEDLDYIWKETQKNLLLL